VTSQTIGRLLTWVTSPRTVEERNIRNVLIDGIGVGIASGIGTFLSVFLVRLGATSFQVGLLTAMPALTGMLFAIPVSRYLERQRNIVPWYSRARFLVLSSYVLTGFVPFLVPTSVAPLVIIGIWAAVTIPQTIVNVAFTVVMGGVAGPNRRFFLMSRRWSILGFTNALVVALVGQFLERVTFPINYQIAFLASFVGGLTSLYFSSHIVLPDREPEPDDEPTTSRLARWRHQVEIIRDNPRFARFLTSNFVFRWGQAMPLPLFPLFWVRNLEASDASIGAINTVQGAVLLVAYFLWARLARRWGERAVLLITSLGLVLYPLMTGLSSSVAPLILFAGIAGFFVAGTELVLFNVVLATAPPTHQTTYIGVHHTFNNMAIFFAPLVGTFLADQIGIVPALLISAVVRFAGFALFYLLRVGEPVPRSVEATSEMAPVRVRR
jgi:predicted MFS family arabinose efflux permease